MRKTTVVFLLVALLLTGCVSAAGQASDNATITAQQAKTIALEQAGLTAEQVTGLRAELDRDDGRLEWDVDFHSGGYEYDYTIHAKTGEILDIDKEKDL